LRKKKEIKKEGKTNLLMEEKQKMRKKSSSIRVFVIRKRQARFVVKPIKEFKRKKRR